MRFSQNRVAQNGVHPINRFEILQLSLLYYLLGIEFRSFQFLIIF